MKSYNLSYLKILESESIQILREAVSESKNPVMLYSVGKDSSVMVRLAQKAFFPAKFPFPLLHIDTSFKFPEMYEFRDKFVKDIGAKLIVEQNNRQLKNGVNPHRDGADSCCQYLKTEALLTALKKHAFDVAFGGARRDEEKSRAKERIFSIRDEFGQWDPKKQRPEIWDLFNTKINNNESLRVFPLSNWTEEDIWQYINLEKISIVPLYFSKKRDGINYRYRSLGCTHCTGAIKSDAKNIDEIIDEVRGAKKSERENRLIDLTSDTSMEQKKREGYF